jgi:uncharacterized protein YciW
MAHITPEQYISDRRLLAFHVEKATSSLRKYLKDLEELDSFSPLTHPPHFTVADLKAVDEDQRIQLRTKFAALRKAQEDLKNYRPVRSEDYHTFR